MARFLARAESSLSQAQTFAYLADAKRRPEWDPAVEQARPLSPGPVAVGTTFEWIATPLALRTQNRSRGRPFFWPARLRTRWRLVEYQPPRRLVLYGSWLGVRAWHSIGVEPTALGSRVVYEARLEVARSLRFAEPALERLLRTLGEGAIAGLERTLRRPRFLLARPSGDYLGRLRF